MRLLKSNILEESIKQKLLTIYSFYLDFFLLKIVGFFWLISTTRSWNTASIHLIYMSSWFSKMVVESFFLNLQTSPISQIFCFSSDNHIKFGANWKCISFVLKNFLISALQAKNGVFWSLDICHMPPGTFF